MSLGGGDEDLYSIKPFFPPALGAPSLFETVQLVARQSSRSDGQAGAQILSNSLAANAPSPIVARVGVPFTALDQLALDQLALDQLSARPPVDEPSPEKPLAVDFPSVTLTLASPPAFDISATVLPTGGVIAPEPSSWTMLALGFAALSYAGFHRSRKTAISID